MIFINFLWLFIFMALIDSRPVLKSMDEKNYFKNKAKNNHQQMYTPRYDYDDYDIKFSSKIHFLNAPSSEMKVKNEEIDLSGFQKLISHNLKDTRKENHMFRTYSNENISNWLEALTTELGSLKQLYGLDTTTKSISTQKATEIIKEISEDNTFLGSTADIESVLNEIKQRALHMMLEQMPSSSNIISNAVTETTFDIGSMLSSPKIHSEFTLLKTSLSDESKDMPYNRSIRSIYHNAATAAQKVECELQSKLKNAYSKIKQKISSDLEKELSQSKKVIKEALNKISNSKNKCKSKHNATVNTNLMPSVRTTVQMKSKLTKNIVSKIPTRKKKFFARKTTQELKPKIHEIPKVTDDYSMLSVYEQLLMKSHDNDVIKLLTTYNAPIKEEKLSKRNHESIENINLKRSIQKIYDDDDEMPDMIDYSDEKNFTSVKEATTNSATLKNIFSPENDDINVDSLSNKLSYNDYVNGFKYYLNFQKEQAKQNFSNLVRYQAHKHHKVDDVGKYILKKLPHLPATRRRRYLFDQETFDDQDVSTKSDDSWFKKHFYLFIDKEPPKKFHTAQTVSLKEDQKKYKKLSEQEIRTQLKNDQNQKQNRSKRALEKSKMNLHPYKTKLNTIGPVNNLQESNSDIISKKCGYVTINSVHRPTGVIKLRNNKKKKKRKFKNIFNKLNFNKKHPKKNLKRDKPNRKTRSNPFKILKDIVLRNRYTDSNNKVRKLFDFDVVTPSLNPYFKYINHNQLPNIEAMLRQIPNITSDLESPFGNDKNRYFVSNKILSTRTYFHNKGMYNTKPKQYYVSKDFPLLPDMPEKPLKEKVKDYKNNFNYLDTTRYFDDLINVRIQTTGPSFPTLTQENINNKKDALLVSLLGNVPSENIVTLTSLPEYGLTNDETRRFRYQFGITDDIKETSTRNKYNSEKPFRIINGLENNNRYKLILYENKIRNQGKYNFRRNYNLRSKYMNHHQNLSVKPKHEKLSNHSQSSKSTSEKSKIKYKTFGNAKNRSQISKSKIMNSCNKEKKPLNHQQQSNRRLQGGPKKVNSFKAPDHNFATPLPMKTNDFNKFLEENHIDVQSVTSPLPNYIPYSEDLPLNKNNKIHTTPKNMYPRIAHIKEAIHYENSNAGSTRRHIQINEIYRKYRLRNKREPKKHYLRENRYSTNYQEILKNNNDTLLSTLTLENKPNFNIKTSSFDNLEEKEKNNSILKRNIENLQTFQAKNVAALEIVIDLRKNNEAYNENESQIISSERNGCFLNESQETQKLTNSIQVYIAIPNNNTNKKRAPEYVQVKKIFSALMASPVDIEYQLHTFENSTIPSTTTEENKLSPGLYLLVENTSFPYSGAHLMIKPMEMDEKSSELGQKLKVNAGRALITPTMSTAILSNFHTTGINKDTLNCTVEKSKHKRSIKWDTIKKIFGHDRVCSCRCKVNQTMCKACSASNAVISELIFEFDNLAKYMRDHCTEIQTFFWMNPTGGKKLREVVNQIDKSLNDYYKRVKGKCQGRTCKMFSSGVDKRSPLRKMHNAKKEKEYSQLIQNMSNLANHLDDALILDIFNREVQNHGEIFLNSFNKCLPQILSKRSDNNSISEKKINKVYSLENININLICKPNTIKSTTTSSLSSREKFNNNSNFNIVLNDLEDTFLKEKQRKSIKDFVKRRFQFDKNKAFLNKLSIENVSTNLAYGQNKLRYKRISYPKPNINILVFKNKCNRNKTTRKTNNFKNQDERDLKQKETTLTAKNNMGQIVKGSHCETNNVSLVYNMDKLFKLLGNTKNCSFTQILNHLSTTNRISTEQKTLQKNIKSNVSNHKSNSSKQLVSKEKSDLKTLHTTLKSNFKNKFRNRTKLLLEILNKRSDGKKITGNRNVRNVTTDTYRMQFLKNKNCSVDDSYIITNMTIKENPTIIILDEKSYANEFVTLPVTVPKVAVENEKLRNLLLSVLNYNSKVLNNEWIRAANSKSTQSLDDFSLESTKTFNADATGFLNALKSKKCTNQTKKGFVNNLAHKFSWKNNNYKRKKKERNQKANRIKTTVPYQKIVTNGVIKATEATWGSISLTPKSKKIGDKNLKTCDISSTLAHVVNVQKSMAKRDFEEYVKNIKCYKYEPVPDYFLIKSNLKRGNRRKRRGCIKEGNQDTAHRRRIRAKRTLRRDVMRIELGDDYDTGYDEAITSRYVPDFRKIVVKSNVYKLHDKDDTDFFEKYVKGIHGIYEQAFFPRVKRNSGVEELVEGLNYLPPLRPFTDEVFVTIGDSVTLGCHRTGYFSIKSEESQHIWQKDQGKINNNVLYNASKLYIRNVQKRDFGVYICYHRNVIVRSVKLNVIDVPNFKVVFTPVYRASSSCTYNDLRSVQKIGQIMSQFACGNFCSVRIDEPVCLRDREDNSVLLRTVSVILPKYPSVINCNAECQRNMRSSMAVLYAKNAPVLSSIPVIMMYYDGSILEEVKTWTPYLRRHKSFVSHTLRTKDSNGHFEYHSLAASAEPDSVHVVISCPAGFFLVSTQKICGICSSNTYSGEGDNICISCPEGSVSEPGSTECHISLERLQRSIWHNGSCVSVIGLVSVVAVTYYCAFFLRRCLKPIPKTKISEKSNISVVIDSNSDSEKMFTKGPHSKENNWTHRHNRPPLPPIDF